MNLKTKKINYFDFGLYEATEMGWIVNMFKDMNITNYQVYGFEPFPEYFNNVSKKFDDNPNVKILNLAVSDKTSKLKLHLSKKGPEGHSIIQTKVNLSENFVLVDVVNISEWIHANVDDFENSINIIRMNIEGAEINVFNSLISTGLHKNIALFCGSLADIHKIGISEAEKSNFLSKLRNNNIEVMYLCKDKPESIIKIKHEIEKI